MPCPKSTPTGLPNAHVQRPEYEQRERPVRCSAVSARRVTDSLSLHGVLVPEANQVPVGVGELSPVTPVRLARAMGELDSPAGPVGERAVDVGDLKPESALVRHHGRPSFLKEDREAISVLQRNCLPVRNLELNVQAEDAHTPVLERAKSVTGSRRWSNLIMTLNFSALSVPANARLSGRCRAGPT